MSTNVSSVVSHFPDAENGFSTTTSGSVSSGAATVGLNSVAGYTNGQPAVFVIDPTDITKKQTFTGIIDTSGVQVTSVVWTAGTNTTHALGATVVDYATATHIAMISKGLQVQHKQTGAHSAVTTDSIVNAGALTQTGATTITGALTLKSYDGWIQAVNTWTFASASTITVAGVDVTGLIQAGDRIKITQTTNKYFLVTKVAFSTDSTITVYGGTDYTVANAAITNPFYSRDRSPFGFPMSPTKWMITTTSTTDRTTSSTSYATLTDSITIPIGSWRLEFRAALEILNDAIANTRRAFVTLSSDASTETNTETTIQATYKSASAAATSAGGAVQHITTYVDLAASTTFLMMGKISAATATCQVLGGTNAITVIRAVSAYL